jgi:hypothetical protein
MRGDRNPKASEFWANSANLKFSEIVNKSNCRRLYVEYQYILSNNYIANSLIKPINDYVYHLYPKPDLIKYEDGYLYLRQRTHAEIWIKKNYNEGFYFLDRPWIRQFYPSNKQMKNKNCFLTTYKFYCPWFVDLDIDFEILQVQDEKTPFLIEEGIFKKNNTDVIIIEPNFVNFLFKKNGEHMLNSEHGKISIGTAMYDIKIKINKNDYNQIYNFYNSKERRA